MYLTFPSTASWPLIQFSLFFISFPLSLLDCNSSILNQALCPSLLPWFSRAFIWSVPSLLTAPDSGLLTFSAPYTPVQGFSSNCPSLFSVMESTEIHQPVKVYASWIGFWDEHSQVLYIIFALGQNSSIMELHTNPERTAGCNLASSEWIFIGVAKGTSLAQRLPCIKFQNMP